MKLITIVNTLRRGMQEYTDGNDIFSKVHTFYMYLLNYVFLSVWSFDQVNYNNRPQEVKVKIDMSYVLHIFTFYSSDKYQCWSNEILETSG
jgi:hypothetical protein